MKPLKIFVVDDDRDVAEALAEVLELHGHDVELAHSGDDAIKVYRERDFDIAFMDVRMPGKNGVESFFEIKKMRPDARVVMMTGYSVPELLQQALDGGVAGVLHKPVDLSTVLEKLKECAPRGAVLLADDDRLFCGRISALLREHGFSVQVVHDGPAALDALLHDTFDVLILDLKLPIINGLEVFRKIRDQGVAAPAIIVTGANPEAVDGIADLRTPQVSGMLFKPFDPQKLLRSLEQLVVGAG